MSALEEILENIDFAVSLISISLTLNIFETSYIRFIANVSLLRIFFFKAYCIYPTFHWEKKNKKYFIAYLGYKMSSSIPTLALTHSEPLSRSLNLYVHHIPHLHL